MYAAANPLLPGFSGLKTYAAWPVWSNSFREDVIFTRLPKKTAIKLYHRARAWNRTKQAGRYGGGIGSAALRVLESLIFDFLNFATGRLDPSYTALEGKTGFCRQTVSDALKRLKLLGIISWLRRCTEDRDKDGRYRLRQQTNAYTILPVSQWRGYDGLADEVPPPDPDAWGAMPPLPPVLEQAIMEQRDGGSFTAVLRCLEADPRDALTARLASFGRALGSSENEPSTGV